MRTRQLPASIMLVPATKGRCSCQKPFNGSALPLLQVPGTKHRSKVAGSCRIRAASAAEQTMEDVKPAFDRCTTEAEFLKVLKSALGHPRAPDFLYPAFHDFYNNYKGISLFSHGLQLNIVSYYVPTRYNAPLQVLN